MSQAFDLARVRHDNALRLFDEFVHANVKSADAATLRGLERRFAERLQIQPSYWSQIKARSRQIGERLARQFEQLCHKPAGWMDQPHASAGATPARTGGQAGSHLASPGATLHTGSSDGTPARDAPAVPPPSQPVDDDERFIVGLVLTYYRRHPQRARARLLDLLGEVLTPGHPQDEATAAELTGTPKPLARPAARSGPPVAPAAPAAEDDLALWQRSQAGVAPLPRKR